MNFHAAGRLCAVDLNNLDVAASVADLTRCFLGLGFQARPYDLIGPARSRVGRAKYERGASIKRAPRTVDCSSFTKWVYQKNGIWLPRFAIQQSEMGRDLLPPVETPAAGDLVFTVGHQPLARRAGHISIGHVGLATGEGTVLHADYRAQTVVEESLDQFVLRSGAVQKVRRLIEHPDATLVFRSPPHLPVETSDDFKWIFLSKTRL